MPTAIEKGDVVLFEYDLVVDGKLIETCTQSCAQAEGILRPGHVYRPHLFVVGANQLITGVEKAIVQHGFTSEGVNAFKVDVPPEEGYGPRHPPKTIPLAKFHGEEIKVGMQVNDGDRQGTVIRVGGGRVTADFNHRLAGKTLQYTITVRAVHKDAKARASALVSHHLHEASHGWSKGPDDVETLTVVTPPRFLHDPRWLGMRSSILHQIVGNFAPEPVRVVFLETFEPAPRPKTPPPETIVPAAS